MKVYMYPTPDTIESNHGIGRIVHAQFQYLPEYGIEFVADAREADVIATHTQMFDLPQVDVVHLHGMYWTGDPGSGTYAKWHWKANEKIIQAVRQALVTTVPSPWCQEPFLRDMRLAPRVIGHGIDFDQWKPGESKNYVLWNKNRNRDVCDPTPAWELAEHGIRVVSTFAPEGRSPNEFMTLTGALPHDKMQELVRHAGVYLATVKETYGIGTLEAMACGVPVLGYAYGGTATIVQHKVTGYLARPGDFQDLMVGLDYILSNRAELSEAAREYASTRDWKHVIREYAHVYHEAQGLRMVENHKVSVVISNYNYGRYVTDAIDAAVNQTIETEVIVVDDGSTDDSRERILAAVARYRGKVRLIEQSNNGVASARNRGIRDATGGFIICLDADDRIDSRYAEVLRNALVADRALGVAYTGLGLMSDNEAGYIPNPWPPQFNWNGQTIPHIPPSNAIPCAAMFRKEMWRRVGGYRQEFAPAEDTEFWVRGLSTGFTASKVVDDYLFYYRPHEGSASRTKTYVPIDTWHPWMRDKDYPMGAPVSEGIPPVRSYSEPRVSIIIPCTAQHASFLPRALDSLLGQSVREWEAVVVGPTVLREVIKDVYPFVKFLEVNGLGTSAARNLALEHARAPLCLFLDADDMLMPYALETMMKKYHVSGGRYVYSDWIRLYNGSIQTEPVPDYDPKAMIHVPQHAVTVLMATRDAINIGFDDKLELLEDWDFFARCAITGYHGIKADKPCVIVRIHANRKTQMMSDAKERDKRANMVASKYEAWRNGDKEMGNCCGGDNGAVLAAKIAIGLIPNPAAEQTDSPTSPDVVRMEFLPDQRGSQSFGGKGITPSGRVYKGGNNPFDKYVDADPRDVEWLERSGYFGKVAREGTPVTPVDMDAVAAVIERMDKVSAKAEAPAPAMVPSDDEIPPDDGLVVPDHPKPKRSRKVKAE